MSIGESAVLVLAILVVFVTLYSLRTHLFSGKPLQQQTVNMYMLCTIATIAIPVTQLSPYHLFWFFPMAILLGMLSLAYPFSLLSIPGHLFMRLCLIGVDQAKMASNIERYQKMSERFLELDATGMTPNEIKKTLADEFNTKKIRENENDLWLEFRGQSNTNDVLKAKAIALAQVIAQITDKSIELYFRDENLPNTKPPTHNVRIWIEICIFYVHWTDRVAFDVFYSDLKKRDLFMDELLQSMSDVFSQLWGDATQRKSTTEEFVRHYTSVISEYERYRKLTPEKNEPYGGTLLWEAEKRMCMAENDGRPEPGMLEIMKMHGVICNYIGVFAPESLLSDSSDSGT